MNSLRTIDTHTHVLTEETAALLRKEAPKVPVTITPIDKDSATLDVGGGVGAATRAAAPFDQPPTDVGVEGRGLHAELRRRLGCRQPVFSRL